MTVKAIYENGVFKPREPIHFDEHTEVKVVIPVVPRIDPDDPTGVKGGGGAHRLYR